MRKKWTVEDIEKVIKELDAKYYLNVSEVATIGINPRLRSSLGRVISEKIFNELKVKRVEFSSKLIKYGSDEQILDTIFHEYAHCMQIIYDNEVNHGKTFKEYCLKLGCVPAACASEPLKYWEEERKKQEESKPKRESHTKYVVCCKDCLKSYGYKRKSKLVKLLEAQETHNYMCGYCGSEKLVLK